MKLMQLIPHGAPLLPSYCASGSHSRFRRRRTKSKRLEGRVIHNFWLYRNLNAALTSTLQDLQMNSENSPVDNAYTCQFSFSGLVQVCSSQTLRQSFVTRRFPAEFTTCIEKIRGNGFMPPLFQHTFGVSEFYVSFRRDCVSGV